MTKRILVSLLLLLSLLLPLQGQQPKPSPQPLPPVPPVDEQDVVRITTNLVQVDVVVTKDGKPVTDLRAEDFEVFEDGKPQTITNFSYISNVTTTAPVNVAARAGPKDKTAPPVPPAVIRPQDVRRTIAVVVDDLGMSFESIAHARKHLRKFLEDLAPNDLVAIIRTGGELGALQQFTNDRRVLQNAINQVRWNPCSRAGIFVFAPAGTPEGADLNSGLCSRGNTFSTMKALRFIVRGMGDLPGRKSLVLLSDLLPIEDQEPQSNSQVGNQRAGQILPPSSSDPESTGFGYEVSYRFQLQRIAEQAIRGSVVIYGVDTRGLQYTGPTAMDRISGDRQSVQNQVSSILRTRSAFMLAGREGSDLIARQTGGFLVRNSNDFGLKRVVEDQQGYYLIGFRPSEETFDRKFHKIKARVKRGGLSVRTRAGFYGYTDEEVRPRSLTAQDRLNIALSSPFGASEIPISLTSFFVDEAPAGPLLRSFVYFRPRDLTFTEEAGGWHVASFDLKGILFGDNGRVLSERSLTTTLRLPDAAYERVQHHGMIHSFDIPTKQTGAFQLRIAVREVGSSRIGAAGQFVEIPDLRKGRLALSGIVVRDAANIAAGSASADAAARAASADLVTGNPAWREFKQGATLVFAYAIYNARLDNASQLPGLTAHTRVFRDGQVIFTGNPAPVDVKGQTDPQRITTASVLQLGSQMLPGEYVVQIIVTDNSIKDKPRVAMQWIDLEVVK